LKKKAFVNFKKDTSDLKEIRDFLSQPQQNHDSVYIIRVFYTNARPFTQYTRRELRDYRRGEKKRLIEFGKYKTYYVADMKKISRAKTRFE